jgi:single-stranded-DNA-specific exonuclease
LIEGQGHTMAAGARCKIEDLERVRQALHQTTLELLPEGLPPFVQPVEMELTFAEITQERVDNLERLEPFGMGNPKPVFYTPNVQVHSSLIFGRDETHRKVTLADEAGTLATLTWWNSAEFDLPEGLFDIAYTVQNSTYRGVHSLSIQWVDARQSEAQHVIKEERTLQVIDLRHPDLAMTADLWENAVLWREGVQSQKVNGVNRLELEHCPMLVIYSLPASVSVLRSLLETSQPEQLVLALQGEPQDDDPSGVLNRLAGMVKYALNQQDGWLPFARVSAALNQRDAVVLRGLELLEGLGQTTILEINEEGAVLQPGGSHVEPAGLLKLNNNFIYQVQETASFRKFAAQAPMEWYRQLAAGT